MKIEPRAATLRETALDRLLRSAERRPFQWGVHDCCTFAAACVRERTGRDALAGLTWDSEEAAIALLSELGGLRAAVSSRLGEPIAPLLARAGDIVLAADPTGRELLAVCAKTVLVAPAARGLIAMELTAGRHAWRVG